MEGSKSDRRHHLGLHTAHAKKNLKLVASEIAEHENLRSPMKSEPRSDAVSEVDGGDRSGQARQTQRQQTCVERFCHERDKDADGRREAVNARLTGVVS